MVERVFLGWDRPLLPLVAGWMAGRGADWSDALVVVPTAQSGRRLREALAEACGGAVLSPRMTTPGGLLHDADDPQTALPWEEELAWVAELEAIRDWQEYADIMPEPDADDPDWAPGLARELTGLRRELQENGHSLGSAARRLEDSVESGRWLALARLERAVLRRLDGWGLRDRARSPDHLLPPPDLATRIVLAGVPELPPLVARALEADARPIHVLIAAPEDEAEHFSPCGIPQPSWAARELPWPEEGARVAGDPRHQAAMAAEAIANTGAPSDALAIGCADPEVGEELARALGGIGWPAFHPGGPAPPDALADWWRAFARWLATPDFLTLAALLELPLTGRLVRGARWRKSMTLHRLMDRWMARDSADLRQLIERHPDFAKHKDAEVEKRTRAEAEALLEAAAAMEQWSAGMRGTGFTATTAKLLEIIADPAAPTTLALSAWLERAEPRVREIRKPARFWIDLMLGALAPATPAPPDGRVVDIQGWLEVFHEPGGHLVLCGLNEGRVPARPRGETWLGEPARARLGLITTDARAARDAWLFLAMTRARAGGSVTLLCGKSSAGGDALLPSRLLLTGAGGVLAERVRALFRPVAPPDAGLRRERDAWTWHPAAAPPLRSLSVTAFRDYLACPFRFYLKHVLRMRRPEPERGEWNARDFGNAAHKALEAWGGDPAAHGADATAIADFLIAEVDCAITLAFAGRPPLAVLMQCEALRQRLRWVADTLAAVHADGWRIVAIEREITIPLVDGLQIRGFIDRIDRHEETGDIRILDYKTGNLASTSKLSAVEAAHRARATPALLRRNAHLPDDAPAWHEVPTVKGGVERWCWQNLQLPLYAAAMHQAEGVLPQPCYITLGNTRERVGLHVWERFSNADAGSALDCARWVLARIAEGRFLPPAAAIRYDDYEDLAAGATLAEMLPPDLSLAPSAATP